jgi:CheY-like chemotaxis protein
MTSSTIPHILHIEDSQSDIEVLRFAFDESSVPARFTDIRDGAAALNHIDALAAGSSPLPDLILLDLKLPKVNGHAILAHIRSLPALAQVPVIILSGTPNTVEQQRSIALGATVHILKPMGVSESLALVKQLQPYLAPPHRG